MKIRDVEVKLLAGRMVLVLVHTDEGITGIGEASCMQPPVIKATIETALKPRLVGQDPFQIEKLYEKMLLSTYKVYGQSTSIAISGVEIALWDLMGKALGVPVYQLLGGLYRDKVRVYASFMVRDITPVAYAKRAAEFVDKGFTAVKVKIGARFGYDAPGDTAIETVKEVRAAVGDNIEIMVDANSAYSVSRAIQLGRKLEEYNIFHFEEPVPMLDLDGTAEVARALDVHVAGGEQEHTRYRFKEMLVKDCVDIVQPDVSKCGGLWESKKIAAMADAFGKACTPHCTEHTVGRAAVIHFISTQPNCRYAQEYNAEPNPLADTLLKEPVLAVDGYVTPPSKPGLGIELDEKAVERFSL